MVSASDAYKKAVEHAANIRNDIVPSDMFEGNNEYCVCFAFISNPNEGFEDYYLVNKSDGAVKPIFVMTMLINYPDLASWKRIDISKFQNGVS